MLTQGKLDNHVGGLGLLRSVQLPFVAKAEQVIASYCQFYQSDAQISMFQLTHNDCRSRAYLCRVSHWSMNKVFVVTIIMTPPRNFYLLDGFEAKIVCFKLIGQTGSLGAKLLRHVPNTGGKLRFKTVKVHLWMVLCTRNRSNKTPSALSRQDWPFPNQIQPSEWSLDTGQCASHGQRLNTLIMLSQGALSF